MIKYKFRAEFLSDVETFLQKNSSELFNVEIVQEEIIPDVTVIFESRLELSKIIELMRQVEDGHVMYQTVKPIDEYSEERDYDL